MGFWIINVLSALQDRIPGQKLTILNIFDVTKFSTSELIYFKTNFLGTVQTNTHRTTTH